MGSGQRATLRELFSIDTRSLALFRVLLGAMLLGDLLKRGLALTAHYTDAGVLPRSEIVELGAPAYFAFFHMLGGSAAWQLALFGVAAVLAVMLMVGWRPRAAALGSFVLLVSLNQRNWLVTHAVDDLLRCLVLWSIFLPLGERWSLDARRRPGPARSSVLSVATVALLLQVVFLYEVATVSKLQYEAWLDGRALYSVLQKPSYANPLGVWLLQYPELLRLLSWGTLVVEGLGPLLLFVPWRNGLLRTLGVFVFVYFHLSIWLTVSIGLFQALCIVAMAPFLPAWFWDRFGSAAPQASSAPDPPARASSAGWAERPAQALAALVLCYVTASNLLSLWPEMRRMPEPLRGVGELLLLDQRWRMFANTDHTFQGWYRIVGHLEDGRTVDVLNAGGAEPLEPPESYALQIPSDNWRIYWSNISKAHYAGFRPYVADYYCRDWNRTAAADERLSSVDLILVERSAHQGQPVRARAVPLLRRPCA